MKASLIFIFLAVLIRIFIVEPYQVSSSHMVPTLLKNDYLLVQKWRYGLRIPRTSLYLWRWNSPQRGEVALMKSPTGSPVLRRVIGLPEDRIFYSQGMIFINEKTYKVTSTDEFEKEEELLRELEDFQAYSHQQEKLSQGVYSVLNKKNQNLSFGPYKVPRGHYFVMGDHRSLSQDSRFWQKNLRQAQGEVILTRKKFKRKNSQAPILIPKNTVLKAQVDSYLPVFFVTTQQARLIDSDMRVPVKAQKGGLRGNVSKGVLWSIQSPLQKVLTVENKASFKGGQNQSVIPLNSFYGRAYKIVWSCEKTLPVLSFLCQFSSLRKGRSLRSVHLSFSKNNFNLLRKISKL